MGMLYRDVALIHPSFRSAHPFVRAPEKVDSVATAESSAATVQGGQIEAGHAVHWRWEIGHHTGCVGLWRTEGKQPGIFFFLIIYHRYACQCKI